MKDARGHGSDPRSGHKLAAAYRASHQVQFKEIPTVRQALAAAIKSFPGNISGEGKPMMHEIPDDSEKYQNVLESYGHAMHSPTHPHVEPSHLMHLAHFFHTLAAIAVGTVLAQGLMLLFGGPV